MPRPLRLFEPDGVYFVTGRCLQARLLMRPSPLANDIIAGVLAKAVDVFGIDLFALVFASNHFHLLLRSPTCRIPAFMQFLRSNIAKKLGRHVDWRGKFWDRRYDAEPVLDDDAVVGRLRYILSHGVKERLVARPQDWPGLTAIPELTSDVRRAFAWPGRGDAGAQLTHSLDLAPLPAWRETTVACRRRMVTEILTDITTTARRDRGNAPVLGVRRVLAQRPHVRPRRVSCSPRPLCHASIEVVRASYAAKYRAFAHAYMVASAAYRDGDFAVEFPAFAYRPPWVVPRAVAA